MSNLMLKRSVIIGTILFFTLPSCSNPERERETLSLTYLEYVDRCEAIWTAQIVSVLIGWEFEHKVGAVEWSDSINYGYSLEKIEDAGGHAPLDDDWFYEMSTLFGFEKYGPDMSVQQLGEQWLENMWGPGALPPRRERIC